MDVLILGGFLGSGKTSILLQLAHYVVDTSEGEGLKCVIVENEIGENGVDDKLLRAQGYNVENLFAGCACCSISGEVTLSVQRIQEDINPDLMILECTGLAYPNNIRENLKEALGIDTRICAVTDAKRWRRLLGPMANVLGTQLEGADTILINKTDLVDESEVDFCKETIAKFNSEAVLIPTSTLSPIDHEVWKQVLGR